MIGGDFSAPGLAPIYDQSQPGNPHFQCNSVLNVICSGRLDPVAVKMLQQFYPQPNRPGLVNNFAVQEPIGGVGINLAIQDAVAAANILIPELRRGWTIPIAALRRVQQRRELPTRITQRVQLIIQNNVIKRVLGRPGRMKPPLVVRALGAIPLLQRIPARLVGLGFRREHVTS